LTDRKIGSESGARQLLDLGERESLGDACGVGVGFGDQTLVELGKGSDLQAGIFEMEAVAIAGLHDEFFSATALDPAVENVVIDVERF